MRYLLLFIVILIYSDGLGQQQWAINDTLAVKGQLIYEDDFADSSDRWVVEQMPGGTAEFSDGQLEIEDAKGCTVWLREKLHAPILIEYDAVVIDAGGPHDRVSDLNCFWLATDSSHPHDFFARSSQRHGKFNHYDSLRLYYVGLGGHHNTKTRFRRYRGDGNKPLLPENDLSEARYLITPNAVNHIRIVVYDNIVQYYRNDELVFDFFDPAPYGEGYFGIRTVDNHMTVDNFKVYHLDALDDQ